jgi:hypothetical protein
LVRGAKKELPLPDEGADDADDAEVAADAKVDEQATAGADAEGIQHASEVGEDFCEDVKALWEGVGTTDGSLSRSETRDCVGDGGDVSIAGVLACSRALRLCRPLAAGEDGREERRVGERASDAEVHATACADGAGTGAWENVREEDGE